MHKDTKNTMLFRHAVVSLVLSKVAAGQALSDVIAETTDFEFSSLGHGKCSPKKRTIYRWVAAYKAGGVHALASQSRLSPNVSRVLGSRTLDFLHKSKTVDEETSIPDIIAAAVIDGIVEEGKLSRTTVWRAAKRLNLPLFGTQAKKNSIKRRFEFPHRMQMVLCDGKHFRAGNKSCKRVVFTFLDDATRKVLTTVVGTSETKLLFLRGLHQVMLKYGKMISLYVDNGSAFIAEDSQTVCARIGINLIYGTAGYPEGKGKIERFNQTIGKDLLRTFPGDSAVDSNCLNLENRINHYTYCVYNARNHEGIGMSPNEKWIKDTLSLSPFDDLQKLARLFIVSEKRKVSAANTVKIDGTLYEMPLGYAGTSVIVDEHLLGLGYSVLHEGKKVTIGPVNYFVNSTGERSKRVAAPIKIAGPSQTAARIAYAAAMKSLVTPDGDCFEQN